MKVYVITCRSFNLTEGVFFDRLDETYVVKDKKEAEDTFTKLIYETEDWYWDGNEEYYTEQVTPTEATVHNSECQSRITMEEVEIS